MEASDIVRIEGSAILGTTADPSSIGDLLNDISFSIDKSKQLSGDPDDLLVTTRAGLDANGNRVSTTITLKDYFSAGVSGPDLVVAKDDGTTAATFTAAKIHDLINVVAGLDAGQMGQSRNVANGFFDNPTDTTFAARPISDFT